MPEFQLLTDVQMAWELEDVIPVEENIPAYH